MNDKDAPGYEANLVPLARALLLKFKVIHSEPRLILWQIGKEVVIGWACRYFLDDDLR